MTMLQINFQFLFLFLLEIAWAIPSICPYRLSPLCKPLQANSSCLNPYLSLMCRQALHGFQMLSFSRHPVSPVVKFSTDCPFTCHNVGCAPASHTTTSHYASTGAGRPNTD